MKLLITGIIMVLLSLLYTFNFYVNCEGKVVRGIIGLECIK